MSAVILLPYRALAVACATLLAGAITTAGAADTTDADAHTHAHAQATDAPYGSEHVAPDAPQSSLPPMTMPQMMRMMAMDDRSSTGKLMFDQLEWRGSSGDSMFAWDAAAWYGNDYDKLWFKSEGDAADGDVRSRNELLWNRIVSRWWSLQLGGRVDAGVGPPRFWAAAGVEGLAPYSFDIAATVYVGDAGRTALRLEASHDLLITQRLVIQPRGELQAYGRNDAERGIGSGVSELRLGLRLRYELRREFAPYVGIEWQREWGATADYTRAAGADADELQVVAGLRAWL